MEALRRDLALVLAAIPARYAATRFPGKALAEISGRPMIAWVVELSSRAATIDEVRVITDTPAIAQAAEVAGAVAVISERPAASGTDRIAHLLELDPVAARATVVVNVQGDEPLLEPAAIDATVRALDRDPRVDIATLVRPIRNAERPDDPHLVKALIDAEGRALGFQREPAAGEAKSRIHVGLYVYRRHAFDRFAAASPSQSELAHRLEQLRALELGLVIRCVEVETAAIGVDTPADLERVEAVLKRVDAERISP
jgi:3-deoxy-manno-octulosonate cytidylyltransferase (CMP-KDO synthetase)